MVTEPIQKSYLIQVACCSTT